jgi:hypothetical protein
MRLHAALLAIAICFGAPACAAGQSEWDRYAPGHLQVLVKRADVMLSPLPDTAGAGPALVPSTDFPTKAVVVYTGRVRPVSPEGAAVISAWVKAVREDSANVLSYFEREVLFTEDGVEFWIPVQEPLIATMEAEVGPGNPVVVFATWMGAFRRGAALQSVFAVNEFDATVVARVVDLGPFGRLTLGRPVERVDELLEPGDQRTRALREEVFEGADSILVTLGPNDSLEGLHFVYGRYQTFDGFREGAFLTLGYPRESTSDLAPGVLRSAVWCDHSSRAELQLRAGPPQRVHMLITVRDERSAC